MHLVSTSMTRAVAFNCTKSTGHVGTHESSVRAYLHPGYITSTTIPMTMSMLTIWTLGGNLTCADQLAPRNPTMVVDTLPPSE